MLRLHVTRIDGGGNELTARLPARLGRGEFRVETATQVFGHTSKGRMK